MEQIFCDHLLGVAHLWFAFLFSFFLLKKPHTLSSLIKFTLSKEEDSKQANKQNYTSLKPMPRAMKEKNRMQYI